MKDNQNLGLKISNSGYSFSNISIFSMTMLLCALNLYLYWGLCDLGLYGYLGTALSAVIVFVAVFAFSKKSTGWIKTAFVTTIIQAVVSWAWYLFVVLDLVKYFNNQEDLQ